MYLIYQIYLQWKHYKNLKKKCVIYKKKVVLNWFPTVGIKIILDWIYCFGKNTVLNSNEKRTGVGRSGAHGSEKTGPNKYGN